MRFVSGIEFSKWLNNQFLPNNLSYQWIKEVSSKAVKQSIMNGDKAFKKFFSGKSKFPQFKKKKNQDVKAYFPKNNKTDLTVERHRVKIPTLGFVRIKEKGYLPIGLNVKSGTVSYKAGRYYISILAEDPQSYIFKSFNEGVGVDLGIKDLAVVSNRDKPFANINKTVTVKKLEKKLKREQRALARKYEGQKKNKRGSANKNISKQVSKIQKIHQRLSNIRVNHINQTISEIVKNKPSHITVEDLNIRGMMKNKHLAKAIAEQCFYQFRTKLTNKCKVHGIELRQVDRFYPSSKLCSCCGVLKKDLRLSDRVYECECGLKINRDKNASLNLSNAKIYKIA